VVERLPPIVRLNFDGSLVRVVSALVTGPGGVHSVSARLARGDRSLVLVRTARPLPGLYRVQWEVQAASDEHSYGGQLTFEALKGPPPKPAPTVPAEPPAATAPAAGENTDDGGSSGGRTGLIAGAGVALAVVAVGVVVARRRGRSGAGR
jgi:hypothetical protein